MSRFFSIPTTSRFGWVCTVLQGSYSLRVVACRRAEYPFVVMKLYRWRKRSLWPLFKIFWLESHFSWNSSHNYITFQLHVKYQTQKTEIFPFEVSILTYRHARYCMDWSRGRNITLETSMHMETDDFGSDFYFVLSIYLTRYVHRNGVTIFNPDPWHKYDTSMNVFILKINILRLVYKYLKILRQLQCHPP